MRRRVRVLPGLLRPGMTVPDLRARVDLLVLVRARPGAKLLRVEVDGDDVSVTWLEPLYVTVPQAGTENAPAMVDV